jgi:hypothetical protein
VRVPETDKAAGRRYGAADTHLLSGEIQAIADVWRIEKHQ